MVWQYAEMALTLIICMNIDGSTKIEVFWAVGTILISVEIYK